MSVKTVCDRLKELQLDFTANVVDLGDNLKYGLGLVVYKENDDIKPVFAVLWVHSKQEAHRIPDEQVYLLVKMIVNQMGLAMRDDLLTEIMLWEELENKLPTGKKEKENLLDDMGLQTACTYLQHHRGEDVDALLDLDEENTLLERIWEELNLALGRA